MNSKINFTTDEYRTKYFKHGNYMFHVHPYGKGEWTLSLYEYGVKQRTGYQQIGFHFVMELSRTPISLNEVRNEINKFITL